MNPLFNQFGNLSSSFFITSNSLMINHTIPHIFNSQTNYIQTNSDNERNINQEIENNTKHLEKENNSNIVDQENSNNIFDQENSNNICDQENSNNICDQENSNNICDQENSNNIVNKENSSNIVKEELFQLTNIKDDINNIIKHTLNRNETNEVPNYNFNIEDDSITVNLGNGNGDFNVIKNIMAYLYHKQMNGELTNFGNAGEFVVQSYSSVPIQTTYLFENDNENLEKFDYFPNCKLINKLIGKAEKIKKDDSLLVNEECCFICFEKYKEKELKRKLPHCNHFFHKKCIDKWLKNKSTCPHCRSDLMDHIILSSEDREEYYKKSCSCDDEDEDLGEVEFIQFNLGIIGIHKKNDDNELNNDNQNNNNQNNDS